ncbi:Uncharacterised protein [Cedecea lapagei]|uniref:Uncharacterized protein n=1 Tax=Cedecea lapagei TaxID=158823 RepID=A0A3S4IHH0_9ENTR|nr:Uncharacterised protein [Cedecea lapagei]
MTELNLNLLSPRIKAHKEALIHIVKPPVCTERAPPLHQRLPAAPGQTAAGSPCNGVGPSPGRTHYLD